MCGARPALPGTRRRRLQHVRGQEGLVGAVQVSAPRPALTAPKGWGSRLGVAVLGLDSSAPSLLGSHLMHAPREDPPHHPAACTAQGSLPSAGDAPPPPSLA